MTELIDIGPHRLKCGSITLGIADLMRGEKADVVYSDPPWGQGNVTYWQTINKRHTGQEPEKLSYDAYLEALFTVIAGHAAGPVLLEYGQGWRDGFVNAFERYGFQRITTVELLYRSGRDKLPCDLHVFHRDPAWTLPTGWADAVRHTMGFTTLRRALVPLLKPGQVVLDPCCGMGFTARAALEAGAVFRGNELNRHRLQKTIDKLEAARA